MTVQGNTSAQFCKQANNQSIAVTAANTSSEGGGTVGTSIFLLFTPGANDSFVDFIRWMPTASAAATATTATVGRMFRSTVFTGTTTSANTFLIAEIDLGVASADNSTNPVSALDVPINARFSGSNGATPEYILVTNHAAPAASTQWVATAFAGDY
jgi:hypothetical protein